MKRKVIFLAILIFSLLAPPLFAEKEVKAETESISLFEIDRLIRRTQYDEALAQLNIYMKNHPENFDAVQTRIRRIMNARISYAELAEKLIHLIQTDPGNDKEIYELTSRLEAFEKNPSDENLQFIADLKKSAEFNYFRAQFIEIQNSAAELTRNGSYIAAIDRLKEGFWLYKDDFYEEWAENPEVITRAEESLAELDKNLKLYQEKNYLTKINDLVSAFIKAVNNNQLQEASLRFAEIKNQLINYYSLRNAVAYTAQELNTQFLKLQTLDGDVSDASYLPFLYRFITGLPSLENSGILGVMDKRWNVYITDMNSCVFNMLEKKYEGYAQGVTEEYTAEVKNYIELEKKVIGLYEIEKEAKEENKESFENPLNEYLIQSSYLADLLDGSLKLNQLDIKIDGLKLDLEKMIADLKKKEGQVDDETISSLFASIINISQMLGDRESQELTYVSWAKTYRAASYDKWTGLEAFYEERLSYAFSESASILSSIWTQIAAVFKSRSDDFLSLASKYKEAVAAYEEGIFQRLSAYEIKRIYENATISQDFYAKEDELGLGIKYCYPDISLFLCDYANSYINRSINYIDAYSLEMNENFNNYAQWKNNQEIVGIVQGSLSYFNGRKKDLENMLSDIKSLKALAAKKSTSAQLARNEGDVRYSEAENALSKNEFDLSRRKLQDSLSKYNESLTNQDDEAFSLKVDEKLLALGERITKAENEVIVRDVRDLKNKAKDAYFNGRFDDAEKYLTEAKNRWAVTNVNEDEEIKSLMAFVETALSMNTGRVILPSAPQYPEMSQLINISNQYYDDGSNLLKKGDKNGAEEAFRSALSSIRKVQYVYPLNQDAALLTLKINRELDPQKFQQEFSQKIEAARLMCQKAESRQEGYANLLDYYELEPDYAGLKSLIYQVEVDIGIRQKPVTKNSESSAKKLISQAQTAYKNAGNNEAALKKALALVDQALVLLPDDKSAIALKDSITTKIGGNTLPVLSTEEERLYQLAVQRLQSNNVVGARALVNQILKKPQNGNLQKIKDLLAKIEARS